MALKKEFDVEVKVRMRFLVDSSLCNSALKKISDQVEDPDMFKGWADGLYGTAFQEAAVAALMENPDVLKQMVIAQAASDAVKYLETEADRQEIPYRNVCRMIAGSMPPEQAEKMRHLLKNEYDEVPSEQNPGQIILIESNLDANLPALFEPYTLHGIEVCGVIATGKSSVSITAAERGENGGNVIALR